MAKAARTVGPAKPPPALAEAKAEFIARMKSDGFSDSTIEGYGRSVDLFYEFLSSRGIASLGELTKALMKDYRAFLHYYKTPEGKSFKPKTVADRIIGLRSFFQAMVSKGRVLYDFSKSLPVPRSTRQIPRAILTEDEVARILSLPDTTSVIGFRDRVMLELLYATGIRNAELRNLRLCDVKCEPHGQGGELRIQASKHDAERIVPLHDEMAALLREYIERVRPIFDAYNANRSFGHDGKRESASRTGKPDERRRPDRLCGSHSGWLFLGRHGCKFDYTSIWLMVKKYGALSGIVKPITCHVFRHTIATHLLERGMDIRYIQALLGHKSLATTQIYTRVTVSDLRREYRRAHPKEMRHSRGVNVGKTGRAGRAIRKAGRRRRQGLVQTPSPLPAPTSRPPETGPTGPIH